MSRQTRCFLNQNTYIYAMQSPSKPMKSAPGESEKNKELPTTSQGPLYRVFIHNDPVTPMDFVIYVLQDIFLLAGVRAVQVMFTAHFHGKALVMTLPKPEALQRVHRAHYIAAAARYPLHFTIEPE